MNLSKFFLYTLILSSFTSCFDSDDNETKPSPKACFDIKTEGDINTGDPVEFSSCATNANNTIWNFGDGITFESNDIEVSHTYEKGGDYNVYQIVINESGADSVSKTITILESDIVGIWLEDEEEWTEPCIDENGYHNEDGPWKVGHSFFKFKDSGDVYDGVYFTSFPCSFEKGNHPTLEHDYDLEGIWSKKDGSYYYHKGDNPVRKFIIEEVERDGKKIRRLREDENTEGNTPDWYYFSEELTEKYM